MNNYCTNCGNKLNKNDLVCQNCNTPIIDLPYNYIYKSPQKKRINKILIISLSTLVSLIILIILGYILKINVLKTKYVEKYILDNNLKLDFLTKVKEISLSHENNSKNGFISVIVFITNIIFFASLIATILMFFI